MRNTPSDTAKEEIRVFLFIHLFIYFFAVMIRNVEELDETNKSAVKKQTDEQTRANPDGVARTIRRAVPRIPPQDRGPDN